MDPHSVEEYGTDKQSEVSQTLFLDSQWAKWAKEPLEFRVEAANANIAVFQRLKVSLWQTW